MENKEIITENELLELANRYIQLEKEHEKYVKFIYLKLYYSLVDEENSCNSEIDKFHNNKDETFEDKLQLFKLYGELKMIKKMSDKIYLLINQ
jgi:DNA polymerase III epsilon subunit-like protein